MIFDSHAHYDDEQFDCDREELLDSMQEHGIGGIINVGASMEGVFASQELAEKYPFIYAGVGIHPDYVGSLNELYNGYFQKCFAFSSVFLIHSPRLDKLATD